MNSIKRSTKIDKKEEEEKMKRLDEP
jgi:hypothetical protein